MQISRTLKYFKIKQTFSKSLSIANISRISCRLQYANEIRLYTKKLRNFKVKKGTRRNGRFQTDTSFSFTREDSTGEGEALKMPTRFDSARHRLVL